MHGWRMRHTPAPKRANCVATITLRRGTRRLGMIGSMSTANEPAYGPWNPGIRSQIPRELRHLSTIFRPDNVFTSVATVGEMQGLTGFSPSELVAFRPERLALHELLIRVTADFAVPDGSRI